MATLAPGRDRPGRRRTAAAVEPAARDGCDRAAMPGAGRFARGRPPRGRGDLRPARRARAGRRHPPHDPAAGGGAGRLERRAGRDGPAARAGPHPPARQPHHPVAAARGVAALLPPGDLVALGLGEPRARALLRPARGRAHRPAAGLCPDARRPGRRGPRSAIDGAGDGPAPADDTDPSNPGHGGSFDEDDPDRRARAARRRDRRHGDDPGGPRQGRRSRSRPTRPARPSNGWHGASSRSRMASRTARPRASSTTARASPWSRSRSPSSSSATAPRRWRRSACSTAWRSPRRRSRGRSPTSAPGQRFSALAESVELRRDAGDLGGARAAVDRAARQLDVLDHGAVRGAIERVGKEVDAALAKKDDGLHRLNDEEAAFISEASIYVIDQYIKLGDMARARALIHRAARHVRPAAGDHEDPDDRRLRRLPHQGRRPRRRP